MNNYVTGAVIKALREKMKMTQEELAQKIFVTSKAVSKWETGKGFPDIGLLESLGKALGVSVIELLSGESITNQNKACNMAKGKFYVCPVCGNIIHTTGEAVISCCGITLPALEAEETEAISAGSTIGSDSTSTSNGGDSNHALNIEVVEDEYFVTINHPMTKEHYISFIAAISDQGIQLTKLYPEGPAQARFKIAGVRKLFAYCNRHGLFELLRKNI
ncbi:MAG: helix-turn-helix domain-containing protein [Treponema sp.]|nr:helix-turn-helix domain-containing protein [Treponema sp.]